MRFQIAEIALFERPVTLRLPFKFGVVTLTGCPQAFVRVRIVAQGHSAMGGAAELLVPKWFDKSPEKSDARNIEDLRISLKLAARAYTSESMPRTAFGYSATHYRALLLQGAEHNLNALTASYGGALLDRAVLDALCRMQGVSFVDAMRGNLPGIEAHVLTTDLEGFDMGAFLAKLSPSSTIQARHTVGMLDSITRADVAQPLNDGLPETLEDIIQAYGHRYFKLKVRGDLHADLDRLEEIAAVLDRKAGKYFVTLDGNEQFADVESAVTLWRAVLERPRLETLAASTLSIEQPLPRVQTDRISVSELARLAPVLIDESDATLDSFVQARELGYTGVSSKSCKGLYKSVLNSARCARWNTASGPRYFLSAEDLTMQSGLAVQQDLALVSLLGLTHVERNGHHYVNGFAGTGADEAEQQSFLAAHAGLYEYSHGGVRLAIHGGRIDLGSLSCRGFASEAMPALSTMTPLGAFTTA